MSANYPPLTLSGFWKTDGRRITLWVEGSRRTIARAKEELECHLRPLLLRSCSHLKGHGGAKGMVREIQAALPEYPFAAQFDVASYYETINHEALLSLLEKCACPPHLIDVVRQYLTLPDRADTGVGLSAGGSLSPLPGHSTCIHWMPYLLSSPGNSGQT